MIDSVSCRGAPRDLGWDQGRACATTLRGVRGSRGWRSGRQQSALLGDLRRHFPHQAEQLEGIARGAGIRLAALASQWLMALREPASALAAVCAGRVRLYAPLPSDAILRRCHSEGRFETTEFSRPAFTAPLLGVNEAGLAVAVLGHCADEARFAPGALLARDCLERFEVVEAALAWCQVRPAAPGHALLFSDAAGELGAVDRRGSVAQRVEAVSGLICLEDSPEVSHALCAAAGRGESALHAELEALWGDRIAFADPLARSTRLIGPDPTN